MANCTHTHTKHTFTSIELSDKNLHSSNIMWTISYYTYLRTDKLHTIIYDNYTMMIMINTQTLY